MSTREQVAKMVARDVCPILSKGECEYNGSDTEICPSCIADHILKAIAEQVRELENPSPGLEPKYDRAEQMRVAVLALLEGPGEQKEA